MMTNYIHTFLDEMRANICNVLKWETTHIFPKKINCNIIELIQELQLMQNSTTRST